jgi:serine/threonine protein kinase
MAVADGGRFKLEQQLGCGSFGEVWRGTDNKMKRAVAVKLEVKQENGQGQLVQEYELLHCLKDPIQQQGFVEVLYFGRQDAYVYMVMELLGPSLDDCLATCGGKLTAKSTLLLAEQVLRRLEYLHSRCCVHRDVKPENFMMGLGPRSHIVYLVDFGLSGVYYQDGEHTEQYEDTLTGNPYFASIGAHRGAQSRRDDLEAVGYMLIYFLTGTLPWVKDGQAALAKDGADEEERVIESIKKNIDLNILTQGLPAMLKEYVRYSKGLAFAKRPDYVKLHLLFASWRADCLEGPVEDHQLEWLVSDSKLALDVPVGSLEKLRPWASDQVLQPDHEDDEEHSSCWCLRRRNRNETTTTTTPAAAPERSPPPKAPDPEPDQSCRENVTLLPAASE